MDVIVRLTPEWYDKLLAGARPHSKAEACLQSAAHRQTPGGSGSEYVLRCDEQSIALVAALADIVCPEAISAMLAAYREAKRAV